MTTDCGYLHNLFSHYPLTSQIKQNDCMGLLQLIIELMSDPGNHYSSVCTSLQFIDLFIWRNRTIFTRMSHNHTTTNNENTKV